MSKNLRNSDTLAPDGLSVAPQPVVLEGSRAETLRREALKLAADWMGERRKVLAGLHVDVSVLDNGPDATVKVDDIRAMRRDSLLRPFDGEVKVYVIAHAHNLTVSSQNALLRILEEPPPYVRFILCLQDADALLDTVRSRCEIRRTVDSGQLTVDSGQLTVDSDSGRGTGDSEAVRGFISALDDPWKRAEAAFSWEKLSRDALRDVLTDLLRALRDACVREGCKPIYLKTIKTVSGLLPSLELNASVGTICGALALTACQAQTGE